MSREVRRVPLDFDWPLNEVWQGYLMPEDLHSLGCQACEGRGYSPEARHLYDQWYGYAPFRPEDNGSVPLTIDTPAVRAFAERNVANAPEYYGTGDRAIRDEARRLCALWNGMWCHHVNADDVAALVAADRLWDFTRTWSREAGWQPKTPPVVPTPEQVNEWNILTFGHDAINASVAVRARCERDGLPLLCPVCNGEPVYRDDQHKAAHNAWQPVGPPEGEGWQLWETVSEGSPVTPVFATADELIDHLTVVGQRHSRGTEPMRRTAAEALVRAGSTMGSIVQTGGQTLNSDTDADLVEAALSGDPAAVAQPSEPEPPKKCPECRKRPEKTLYRRTCAYQQGRPGWTFLPCGHHAPAAAEVTC